MAQQLSGLEPDELRSKTFAIALRGYELEEVTDYLHKAATALEALRSGNADSPSPPFTSEAIRGHEFTIGWRAADREEVDEFLNDVAEEFERLGAEGPEPEAEGPGLRTTWRPKTYTDESKAAQAKAVRQTNRPKQQKPAAETPANQEPVVTTGPAEAPAAKPAAAEAAAGFGEELSWDGDDSDSAEARSEAADVFFSDPGDTKSREAFGGMFSEGGGPAGANGEAPASDPEHKPAADSKAAAVVAGKSGTPLKSRLESASDQAPTETRTQPENRSTVNQADATPEPGPESTSSPEPQPAETQAPPTVAAVEIATILQQAQESAERIHAEAQATAAKITEEAQTDASALRATVVEEEHEMRKEAARTQAEADNYALEVRSKADTDAEARQSSLKAELEEARAQVDETRGQAVDILNEAEEKAKGIVKSAELRSARLLTEAEEATRVKLDNLLKVGRERLDALHVADRDMRKRLGKAQQNLAEILDSEPPEANFDIDIDVFTHADETSASEMSEKEGKASEGESESAKSKADRDSGEPAGRQPQKV